MLLQVLRVAAVIVLLGIAAAIATPKNRIPLALRGLNKMLRGNSNAQGESDKTKQGETPALWRRMLALLLVIIAAVVCMI